MFNKKALYSAILSLSVITPIYAEDTDIQKFLDTEMLITTLTADDQAALESATADAEAAALAVTEAEGALATAITDNDNLPATASEEEKQAAQDAVTQAEADLAAAQSAMTDAENAVPDIQGELDATTELVGQLSEEQVIALNRSLNNAVNSKLLVDIDSEDLQQVIDGNYNQRQINAFTQSFEQEARFNLKAGRFATKYDETGNEKFLDHASRMEEKGSTQKSKFMDKVDRFSDSAADDADSLAKQEAKSAAKNTAKAASKQAAKDVAKKSAKSAAKAAAKVAAKQSAKAAAKRAAKNI